MNFARRISLFHYSALQRHAGTHRLTITKAIEEAIEALPGARESILEEKEAYARENEIKKQQATSGYANQIRKSTEHI